jgi:hypothetical protein
MSGGRGVGGNREVPPLVLLGPRGDLSGAEVEGNFKEGGSWGEHGFPHESEPKASDGHGGPGDGPNLPTTIVTVVPGGCCVPPWGSCVCTMPS